MIIELSAKYQFGRNTHAEYYKRTGSVDDAYSFFRIEISTSATFKITNLVGYD